MLEAVVYMKGARRIVPREDAGDERGSASVEAAEVHKVAGHAVGEHLLGEVPEIDALLGGRHLRGLVGQGDQLRLNPEQARQPGERPVFSPDGTLKNRVADLEIVHRRGPCLRARDWSRNLTGPRERTKREPGGNKAITRAGESRGVIRRIPRLARNQTKTERPRI